MSSGRNQKCVIQGGNIKSAKSKKVMPHDEFINRIRKSFYFGADTRTEEVNISRPLAEYASDLFSEPYSGHTIKRLYIGDLPSFCAHASPCSLIMALIYLDRLSVIDPCYLRCITPQELFVVSMMISTKFYAGHDEEFYLSNWAEDGEISEERLKKLELQFLCAIEWNIYISNDQFFEKLKSIEKTLAKREGLKRGWLTYTELINLLPSFTLAKFIFQNIVVMAVSYAASVITIAGAFFLASQIPGNALNRNTLQALRETSVSETTMVNETLILTSEDVHGVSNDTSDAMNANTTVSAQISTCTAFNVEAELLTLERQYREEAERDKVYWYQNEINSDSRLNLPSNVILTNQNKNRNLGAPQTSDNKHNWLSFKEEYSDDFFEKDKPLSIKDYDEISYHDTVHDLLNYNYMDSRSTVCMASYKNCTGFIFWQVLAEVAQQSLVRLPVLWYKFI